MKNNLSRRSFINNSIVNAAVAANVSLLVGLASAQDSSFSGAHNPVGCNLPNPLPAD